MNITESQKVLAGIIIAIVAVIYNVLKDNKLDKIEIMASPIAILLILAVGFWLYKSAQKQDNSDNLNNYKDSSIVEQQREARALYQGFHPSARAVVNSKQAKESYYKLIDLIVYAGDKSEFHKIIDALEFPKRGQDNYQIDKDFSYFYLLNNAINEVSINFMIKLDWKQGVNDLHWFTKNALVNTKYIPKLPPLSNYPSDASILYGLRFDDKTHYLSQVFEEYIFALNNVGLGVAFLPTHADYFVIFIYRLEDESAISEYIFYTGIGFGSPK